MVPPMSQKIPCTLAYTEFAYSPPPVKSPAIKNNLPSYCRRHVTIKKIKSKKLKVNPNNRTNTFQNSACTSANE